jgi:hypothetical protein
MALLSAISSFMLPTGSLAADATADENDATRFRETFGLQADLAFVRTTLDDTRYSSEAYGVPLTSAEVSELFRRARIETSIGDALDVARSQPGFAGVYLDQQRGGRPIFMFTSVDPTITSRLAALLPEGANVEIRDATYTEAELMELKAQVESQFADWQADGVVILAVGIDVRANRLQIGVADHGPETEARLQSRYGNGVAVLETKVAHSDVCDGTNDCRPIKGAIAVNPTGAAPGRCTAGFVVERTDNAALAILTAGHCVEVWGGFDQAWQHNSQGFGRALYETWEPGGSSDADVGLITIQSPEVALMTNKNQIRRTNGSVANVSAYISGHPLQGGQACRVGTTSGHDCGSVRISDVGHWSVVAGWHWMWVSHTVEVDFDSAAGDSGGPVFRYPGGGTCCSPVWALGTHVHSLDPEDNTGWFSPITRGVGDYNDIPSPVNYTYRLCLTAAC